MKCQMVLNRLGSRRPSRRHGSFGKWLTTMSTVVGVSGVGSLLLSSNAQAQSLGSDLTSTTTAPSTSSSSTSAGNADSPAAAAANAAAASATAVTAPAPATSSSPNPYRPSQAGPGQPPAGTSPTPESVAAKFGFVQTQLEITPGHEGPLPSEASNQFSLLRLLVDKASPTLGGLIQLDMSADNAPSSKARDIALKVEDLRKAKKYSDELALLEPAAGKNPIDIYIQLQLAEALSLNRKSDKALQVLSEARKLNPKILATYLIQYQIYEQLGQKFDTLAALSDALLIAPESIFLSNEYCRVNFQQGYVDKAVDVCKKAISLESTRADNHVYLGYAYIGQKNLEVGDKILVKAAQQFRENEFTQYAAAKMAVRQKDWTTAYGYFAQGFRVEPRSMRSVLGYAQSAMQIKKYPESINAFLFACGKNYNFTRDFRLASAWLRKEKNDDWANKFDLAIDKCKTP